MTANGRVRITLDGRAVEAPSASTVLAAAPIHMGEKMLKTKLQP